MLDLANPNRELWLWMFSDGGAWTAYDLARQLGREDITAVFDQLSGMARRGLVEKMKPTPDSRRLRYAVTGTCLVPHGMHVAEVQMDESLLQLPAVGDRSPSRAPAFNHCESSMT